MKQLIIILLLLCPVLLMAQGQKGAAEECAPMKNGKVCYTDEEEINATQGEIFNAIYKWANKSYGKDIFLSNVSANQKKGTILVSSKVELLMSETEKTLIKYKMYITCLDNKYTVEAREITYQYTPDGEKKVKVYKAEDVIRNNGKSNTISLIKDPELFCNATYFFIESLFADVHSAAGDAE